MLVSRMQCIKKLKYESIIIDYQNVHWNVSHLEQQGPTWVDTSACN